MYDIKSFIESGKAVLGIELGSTRIKAVLIGQDNEPIAAGGFDWENSFLGGVWTYPLESAWSGLAASYADLCADVYAKFGCKISSLAAIGISAMMHGYLVFDKSGELLVPFRTWRNTMTGQAAAELTELFNYNIPQRWSIAHLYQAILNKEPHVGQIGLLTTLAGYIHKTLTGVNVIGVGEASGMFPVDLKTRDFDETMIAKFETQAAKNGASIKFREIMPAVALAGQYAGVLSETGAKLLDPSGLLAAGAPLCPPEGDAGTGMVATNAVKVRTGNVSAGTSVFAMVVLERALSKVYPEIDLITTPAGDLVGMVHCNNCSSDLNAWAGIFREFSSAAGVPIDMNKLYAVLYNEALKGDTDCGGVLTYNYFSGEHITGFTEGRPVVTRLPDSKFSLANFMRANLFSSVGALSIGMEILFEKENVKLDMLLCHGGLFKTERVGQFVMAAAAKSKTCVMETAGEGGAWGIAVLAAFLVKKEAGQSLDGYLESEVFADAKGLILEPDEQLTQSFACFMERYKAGFDIERAAIASLTK